MIIFLTHSDTDLLTLSHVIKHFPENFSRVQAFNPRELNADEALENFTRSQLTKARLVILRLLGGKQSFEAGFNRIAARCQDLKIPFIACPGDLQPDPELVTSSTVPGPIVQRTFSYLLHGGTYNVENLFLFLSDSLLHTSYGYQEPRQLPWDGIYHPEEVEDIPLDRFIARRHRPARPTIGLLFYRAHWMSRNLDFINALIHRLEKEANVLPVYCYSVRDVSGSEEGQATIFHKYFIDLNGVPRLDCLLSTLSFSASQLTLEGATIAQGEFVSYLKMLNVPIIQAIVCTNTQAEWAQSALGLSPMDVAMNVAMPEFDGRIISVPISFKEEAAQDNLLGAKLLKYVPASDRIDFAARLALNWARLRQKPNIEKRLAILLTNYPSKNARIGNAVGLDTPASVINLLHQLKKDGYRVGEIPSSGDALIHQIIARCSNDREFLTEEQMRTAVGHISEPRYNSWFKKFPEKAQTELITSWGKPPGETFRYDGSLVVPGIRLENVFIGLQPPRGFGDNPLAIYHSPDLPPTHHYVAYYRWLRDEFKADAVLHIGKHGTLEWLPGKGIGLSESCYPELVLSDLPNFYPYIINNPGEGTQAKRRSHATIIDHLIPAMTNADSYGDLAKLEQLLDEYYQTQTLDPKKLPIIRQQIWQCVVEANFHHDLRIQSVPEDFDAFLREVDGYICELKDAQIRDGLHTLGHVPSGEQLIGLLLGLTRLDNLKVPSLRAAVASAFGLNYASLIEDRGQLIHGSVPPELANLNPGVPCRTHGDLIERIDQLCRALLAELAASNFQADSIDIIVNRLLAKPAPAVSSILRYVSYEIYPNLRLTTDELTNVLRGLRGEYVPAGPSGSPTRGMANILPTGRNFYSVDPKSIPSRAAWEVGKQLAEALLSKYLTEEGKYPETVGLVVWGTSAMRTHGDDVAEILYLLGIRPLWQQENRRVKGLEVIPLKELNRPRIDVTVRISGFFRDAFPNLIHLIDEAVSTVARLDESPHENYVVKHIREDLERQTESSQPSLSRERVLYRIFGSKPGTYGAGILPAIDQRNWKTDLDLANIYITWGSYAYTRSEYGTSAPEEFKMRFRQIVVAAKNQDNREHDIFDSDDYLQYHGGMIATIRALTGRNPKEFFGDSSNPQRASVRGLKEEALRVFRTRVVNPKWLASIKRHGYKGASELAATVDYLFGYDATAQIMDDWMYADLTQAYVFDKEMQKFFAEKNPWALHDIAARLLEAIERKLWENPSPETIDRLREVYLQIENEIEKQQEKVSTRN